jgi:tetratricopeptide (TPR) repeat protein
MSAGVAAPKRQSLLESIKGVSKSEKRRVEGITRAKLLLAQAASADPAEAVLLLTEAIALRPVDAVYFEARAQALHANGDPHRAMYDWSMTVQLEPACLSHRMHRAAMYQALDDPARAIEDLTEAIRLAVEADATPGTLGGIHAARGAPHAEAGLLEHAAVDLAAAADLLSADDSARAHEQHGDCLRRLGRPADAAAAFRRALSGASHKWNRTPAVRRALSSALREAGQAELAVAEAKAALASHNDDVSLHIALGEALAFTGRGFDALRPLAAAAARLEEEAHTHANDGGGQPRLQWDSSGGGEACGAPPRFDEAFSALGSCLLQVGAPRLGVICYDRASEATRGAYDLALRHSQAAQAREEAVGALTVDTGPLSPRKHDRSQGDGAPPNGAAPIRVVSGAPPMSPTDRAGRSPSRGRRPISRPGSPACPSSPPARPRSPTARPGSPARPSSPGRRPRSPSPSLHAPAPLTQLAVEQATTALEAARARRALCAAGTAFATAQLGAGRCLAAVGLLEDACTRLEAAAAAAAAACVTDPPLEAECRLDLARLLLRRGLRVAASGQLDVCVRLRPTWRPARRLRASLRLLQHEPALCLADIAAVGGGTGAEIQALEPEEVRLRVEALVALAQHAEAQETLRCLPATAEPDAGSTGNGSVSAASRKGSAMSEAGGMTLGACVQEEAGGDALATPRLSLCCARALRARGMQQEAMPWLDEAVMVLAGQLEQAHAALDHEEQERLRHVARYAAFASDAPGSDLGSGASGGGLGLRPRLKLGDLDKAAREEAARMADRPPVVLLREREVEVRRVLLAAHDERGRCLHELHQPGEG